MKVIHFVVDDKFIDSAIDMFESIPWLENKFLLVDSKKMDLEYISSSVVDIIREKDLTNEFLSNEFIDIIVLHSWWSLPNDIINKIDKRIKLVWLSWGADLYSNIWPEYQLIKLDNRVKDPFSKLLYESFRSLSEIKRIMKCLYNGSSLRSYKESFRNAIKRVDYYSGVFPMEYDLIIKYNKDIFNAKRIEFNYARKIDVSIPFDNDSVDILVGNSASCLLNHCEVFNKLKSFDLKGKRVIVPLSYEAGNKFYLNVIKKKGYKIFGDSFIPIVNFMDFREFCNFLLKNCNFAIFDIEQQASIGTITLCLGMGMKVFLPQTSMAYSFYKSLGIRVFSIEKELTEKELSNLLPLKDKIANREIILSYFSYDNIFKKVMDSFNKIYIDIKNANKED